MPKDDTPEVAELRRAKRREYYRKNHEKLRAAVRRYYHENREKVLAGNRASHARHHEERKRRAREKYYRDHEAAKRERRESRLRHREAILARERSRRRELRLQAFAAYGGATCSCCGESRIEFLGIDHIEGGGNRHRESVNKYFYRWLKDESYPAGYRVLCHNCNMARAFYGSCPHESER